MLFLIFFQKQLKRQLIKPYNFLFYFSFKKIQKLVNFFLFSIFSVFFNVFFVKKKLQFNHFFFYFIFFILPFYYEKQYRLSLGERIILTEYEFFIDFFRDLRLCPRLMAMIKKFKFTFLC